MLEVISGITKAIDLAKKIKKSADAIKDSEAKLLIADLMTQLAELKIKCSELVEQNSELKKKLNAKESTNVELIGDVYMSGSDGPFCTTCWDSDGKLIRLKEEIKDFQKILGHKYVCPICKSRHKGAE